MNKYKLVSIENPDVLQYTLSISTPTECPDAGTLNSDSIVLIEEDVKERNGLHVDGSVSLDDYKKLKHNEIDGKTGELIAAGYTFASKQFSLSQNAQLNLLGLNMSKDDLTYPVTYNTMDNADTYSIPDAATIANMYGTALTVKKGHLDSGTALKESVNDAVDRAGVDAVTDNR